MIKATKILAVIAIGVLLFSQAAYANSFSDFWTRSKWSKGVQNFAVKSVYQDRIHGFAYKKILLPTGRNVALYVAPERVANAALKNGDWGKAINAINVILKEARVVTVFTGPLATAKQWASVYGSLAVAQLNKGDYDKSILNCNNALHYTPNDGTLYQNRGAAYLGKKDYFRALKDFEKAQSLGVNLKPEIIYQIRIAAEK